MVQPIPQHKKMELPSVTNERRIMWQDVDNLYNSAYQLLGEAVAFVTAIANSNAVSLPHVKPLVLTNMISGLNKDVIASRTRLNNLYKEITANKSNTNMQSQDLFMMKMQLTQSINEWTDNYKKVIGQSISDISDYTANKTVTNPDDLSE